MKFIILTTFILFSFDSFNQSSNQLKIDPGDCNLGNSSSYLFKNESTEIIVKYDKKIDSTIFLVDHENWEFVSNKKIRIVSSTDRVSVSAIVYSKNICDTISQIFFTVEKPTVQPILKKSYSGDTLINIKIQLIDEYLKNDVSSDYVICFTEFKICNKTKILLESYSNEEINFQKLDQSVKDKINSKSKLILTGIRLVHKKYNRSIWLDCQVEILLN
ncbi:MAG: hypothetical protein JNJ99_02050 [Crocinitomicaceae bacterium]|nr:hypothetical protein [Crocinitomicaceae bacterium]